MLLMTRLRESLGEHRTIAQAPAQAIDVTSRDDGLSIVILNCLFLWDCWILPAGAGSAVFLSHDEWGEAAVGSEATRQAFAGGLEKLDLLTSEPR